MPLVTADVIKDVFTAEEKQAMIRGVMDAIVEQGEALRDQTSVRIMEVQQGDWGTSGQLLGAADVVAAGECRLPDQSPVSQEGVA
jgi:4-oxalocrotonate tautomerase